MSAACTATAACEAEGYHEGADGGDRERGALEDDLNGGVGIGVVDLEQLGVARHAQRRRLELQHVSTARTHTHNA